MGYKEMVATIAKAKKDYYQNGRSELTDAEYDRLVSQAEKLGYIETVGAAPVDNIAKITHEHPMLSLDKCHTIDEIKKFANNKNVVAMYKADGLSVSCTYIDGVLTRLETRGDGEVGNDILFHCKSFDNLPIKIDKMGKYVVDGECIILKDDFDRINDKMSESERFSNPRNLAAGSLNLIDTNVTKKRHLRFYVWDVIDGGSSDYLSDNLFEALQLGFGVVFYQKLSIMSDQLLTTILDAFQRTSNVAGFPIDGVVFKFDDIKYGKSLGLTGHHPRNAIAYKYKDDSYPTKLRSISWQVGKTSQITPVANFDKVVIDGTEVEKCSLHNISIMKSLELTKNCTVYVYKANQIIPQIAYADSDGDEKFDIPDVCPECGHPTKIIKANDSEVLYCANDNCPGKMLGLWETFVSKKGMDIAGLSEQTLKILLHRGYLTNMFVSIYELDQYKKDLYKLDGFGKKSIDSLLKSIEDSKSVDLIHFITAFSIPGVGTGQSKLLATKYHTFDEFMEACDNQDDFTKIPGIGKVLDAAIKQWWVNNHVQMIDISNIVKFKNEFMNPPTGNYPLAGKTFVVTGSVNQFKNRTELQNKIEELGGKVSGSVSKNTSYLINNDVESTSGKNKKAKDLGVPIISEEQFLQMC